MEFRDFGVIVKLSMSLEIPRSPRRVAGFLSHVGGYKYYSFNYQYYLEYLLFLIPLVFLFYRIVKIHFRCESILNPTLDIVLYDLGSWAECAKMCRPVHSVQAYRKPV